MSDTAMQTLRRVIAAVNLLFLIPGGALGWMPTRPANPAPLSGSRIPLLLSPYTNYRLKLNPFVPSLAQARGVLLTVHINGGPALNLLLDSGARDVVLGEKPARKSGVRPSSLLDLVGIGESPVRHVPVGTAKTLEIDQLVMANVPVAIVSSGLAEGIDGVVPTVIFSRFLIRIDFPERALILNPYPRGGDACDRGDAVPTHIDNGILFLTAKIESQEGYLLLDTGSAYSAIAGSVAKCLRLTDPLAPLVNTQTANGLIQSQRGRATNLRIGNRNMSIDGPLILNLSIMSRFHSVEIIGVLGFSALERSVISLNYRDCQSIIASDQPERRPAE